MRLVGKKAETSAIDGSSARRVVNSEDDLIELGGMYYCWQDGVWFGGDNPKRKLGPVDALPEGLLPLPTSSGLVHVNTTRPLGTTDKEVATETTAAMHGIFLNKGTPVYGTGFRVRGLMRNNNWYPCARTYGENRWYDPVTGTFQPRNVLHGEDGRATATTWSPYVAGYGRVRAYANRYRQGGRRMFRYDHGRGRFDAAAGYPDALRHYKGRENLVSINGIPAKKLPLGDRAGEPANEVPAMVADDAGTVFRRTETGGSESYKDGKWTAATPPAEVKSALDTMSRIVARPAELAAWAARRRAPLPVNPEATGD